MSNNLGITQLTSNQNNKENTINNADGRIDAAMTEQLSNALTGASPTVTITTSQAQQAALFIFTTGTTPTGTATVNFPAIKRGFIRVRNESSIPLDFGISGQPATKPRVYSGTTSRTLYCDGTNVRVADGGEALGQPFDLGVFFPSTMTDGQLIVRYVFTRDVDFPTNLSGSFAKAVSAATAQTDIDVQKNGGSIGTIRFAASGTVATFPSVTATAFAAGDILSLFAPTPADATLADVGFTLKGTRRA